MYSCRRGQDHRHSDWHARRPSNRVSTQPPSDEPWYPGSHNNEISDPSSNDPDSTSSFIAIGAATLADICDPAERGKMMGIFYAAPLLGPSLGPLLGGVLTQAFSWRAAFWLLAALLGIDLVLFTFFFRDTFRRERSLTYRHALARRHVRAVVLSLQPDAAADTESTKAPVAALAVGDTIESKERIVLGDGPSSPSSACATMGDDMQAVEIALSLADVNPFPPLVLVLRRRNNVTTLIASGTIHFYRISPRPGTHWNFSSALRLWLLHRIHVLPNGLRHVRL